MPVPTIDSRSFNWSPELYGDGLKKPDMERVSFRDKLWHDAQRAGWPRDPQGRIEFHASVLTALRKSTPGSWLTACVREKRFGSDTWASKEAMKAAKNSIMGHYATPPRVPKPHEKRLPRQHDEIDQQIATMSIDQMRTALSDQPEFHRVMFERATAGGQRPAPRSSVYDALRIALGTRPPAPPPAPAPLSDVLAGVDMSGLDLEVVR